ncbi:MAG: hypothetical protein ACJ74W_16905 [Pyrinomonadaceae bacterium]
MPQNTTTTDRIKRLLTALSRDVQETEGRELDYETSEAMLRTINAARAELDALALDLVAEEAPALAA